ncbi:MAG: Benzoyl-CoA reductase subunit B [Pelotomaculum sp. PtaB.Bin013]|nr:MAG: Benzoyl-CoA reductase subunit B [Pelotomaculum sp. PtaB.Bin013]
MNRPLESLVKNHTEVFINRGYEYRLEQKISLMNEFKVDGFILFSNRSCKPKALGLYDKYNIISERTGLPGVIFEADMSDERYFNEEYIKNLFGEFFDRLEREST